MKTMPNSDRVLVCESEPVTEDLMAARMKKYADDFGLTSSDPLTCDCGKEFYPAMGEGFIHECGPKCSEKCFNFYTDT